MVNRPNLKILENISEEVIQRDSELVIQTLLNELKIYINLDPYYQNLEFFIKFSVGRYNIGVIHILPDNLEEFTKKHNLQILIFGHTHQPLIKGTDFNVLLLNPGSPTKPKAPIERPGFMKPIARPSVITLNIDENDILSTFIINLKI